MKMKRDKKFNKKINEREIEKVKISVIESRMSVAENEQSISE
jgi:hypothetical protein